MHTVSCNVDLNAGDLAVNKLTKLIITNTVRIEQCSYRYVSTNKQVRSLFTAQSPHKTAETIQFRWLSGAVVRTSDSFYSET